MRTFPESLPQTICFFLVIYCFFSSGFLPVLRTMCRWKSSLHPFPILFDFFWLFFVFFSGFCQFWEQSADENLPCILSPYYLFFFPDYFLIFFLSFWQFWEQSADENLPCLLSPYYWIFFLIIFCFFLRVLPVLRTICKWKPSLHPFPILFVFFSDYLLFFSWVFGSFENNLQMKTFPASFPHTIGIFLIIFCFFLRVLPVLRPICKWKPSLHPFPILFVFFSDYYCFFSLGFCQFWALPASFPHTIWSFSDYLFEPWFCLHYFLLFWFVFLLIFYFGLNPCFLESVEFAGSQR